MMSAKSGLALFEGKKLSNMVPTLFAIGLALSGTTCTSSDNTTQPPAATPTDTVTPDSGVADSDWFPADSALDYDTIFVQDHIITWEIQIDENQWVQLLADPKSYVEADLTVDGTEYPSVGLRILGKRDRAKVSMRVRFNRFDEGQTFHGVKRLNLHGGAGDTSSIREALALSLMREAGVPAPRHSFVWVTTNQGPKGVYTLIEQVDKRFLFDRFGEKSGNLYKGERGAGLQYLGDDQSLYPDTVYERKTNEKHGDRSDLINFIKVLDQTDPLNLDVALSEVLDLEGFMRWLAVNTWIVAMDSYAGTVDNYYLYHGEDGRFRFIPWDLNQAFGNYHGASCSGSGTTDCLEPMGTDAFMVLDPDAPYCRCSLGERPLIEKLLAHPNLRDRYHEIFRDLIDHPLNLEYVKAQMVSMQDHIEASAHQDTQKACYHPPCTNALFDAALYHDDPESDISNRVPGLVTFAEARDQRVRQALELTDE
jgi:spore coat protein H